ncbi:MAG: type II secretion system protein [Candidatus Sericytochromatia bacterium]
MQKQAIKTGLKSTCQRGMTIYEILTVAIIISVLVMIALPNFIANKDRANDSQIESNARTLRVMLETYKVDHKLYPDDLRTLGYEATKEKYNKAMANPYSKAIGEVESGKWAIDYVGPTGPAGMVTYQPLAGGDKYYIFGYAKDGTFHKKSGKIFTMSNG